MEVTVFTTNKFMNNNPFLPEDSWKNKSVQESIELIKKNRRGKAKYKSICYDCAHHRQPVDAVVERWYVSCSWPIRSNSIDNKSFIIANNVESDEYWEWWTDLKSRIWDQRSWISTNFVLCTIWTKKCNFFSKI